MITREWRDKFVGHLRQVQIEADRTLGKRNECSENCRHLINRLMALRFMKQGIVNDYEWARFTHAQASPTNSKQDVG